MESQNHNCCCNEMTMLPIKGFGIAVDTSVLKPEQTTWLPNLQIGIETKMNLRIFGKQVYAQYIDFGTLPAGGSKRIEHNIENVDWIKVSEDYSYAPNSSDGFIYPVNYPDDDKASESWCCVVNKSLITMTTGINRTNLRAVICLQYTKTTDEPIK